MLIVTALPSRRGNHTILFHYSPNCAFRTVFDDYFSRTLGSEFFGADSATATVRSVLKGGSI